MRNIFVFYQTLAYRFISPFFSYLIYGPVHIVLLLFRMYPAYARFNSWWAAGTLPWIGQKFTMQGREYINSAPKEKRFLVVANHASYMDIPAIISLFPDVPVTWVVKESLLSKPIVGQLIQLGVGTPIATANARASQNKILERTAMIRKNMNPHIAIFPEGTRTKDGNIQKFKRGFVLLMRQYELDILPVTINGFSTFDTRRHFWTNPEANIEVVVHPPVSYASLKDKDDKEIAQIMHDIVESAYHP
ncbi:MAG: lysophospholipid acyltransferase family protein [Brevinema sp.]